MCSIFISSPHVGGLFQIEWSTKKIQCLKDGNVRGICVNDNQLYHVNGNDNIVFNNVAPFFSFKGNGSLHDVKIFEENFYIMSTLEKRLLKFDYTGQHIKQLVFDNCYWANCCLIDATTKNIVIFLSAKRPYSKSKIICLNSDWNLLWEFNCLEGDEIHSPFLLNNDLYWCRSNYNSVVCASLSLRLKNVKKVLINNSGYTRGLTIVDNRLFLGTSENRHAETSLCNSNINSGCVHSYLFDGNSYVLEDTLVLETKEVYDIVDAKNTIAI